MQILVAGGGPVAFLYARLFLASGARVQMWQRGRETECRFSLETDSPRHARWTGHFQLHSRVHGEQELWSEIDWIVLAVPAPAYGSVFRSLTTRRPDLLEAAWLLPSATLGSSLQLEGASRIVSLSSFFAASKRVPGETSRFLLRGLKRRIYAGATAPGLAAPIAELLAQIEVETSELLNPLAAEARNIVTYVHPPLCLNEHALGWIFQPGPPKYMYKLYPQGPITREVMESMLRAHEEIQFLLGLLGVRPFNLLAFLNDDNYPVLPVSIDPQKIADFPRLSFEERTLLLYIRYASLLIDPWSQPDENTGNYPDFSAVAMPALHENGTVPRVPLEDYRTALNYAHLGLKLGVKTPEISRLCHNFESALAGWESLAGASSPHSLAEFHAEAVRLAERIAHAA
ncbi:MAG: opine metallophore biosynthesis dehydrogenase [Candidatus Eremiobacteraeota bacterium]|nr:opine metallophore biosynthesis dehydrogenase [Candidatus Eremiobacteraeota bacterium]MCW5869398.1 opine metallophore biosynthesis dehydrogenase [Candidatus Eremiobacteraeota bacterium]